MCARSSLVPVLASVAIATIIGCGPDARRARAEEAVRTASVALDEADATSGGEEVAISSALARSHRWLDQSQEAIEVWGSSGSLAYETSAACLASALGQLRDAIVTAGRPVPAQLEEAEALVQDAVARPCAERGQATPSQSP